MMLLYIWVRKMKKKNIINLIKYHSENNKDAFRDEAYEIARAFDDLGDYQLSQYIMSLLSNTNTFVPQEDEFEFKFFEKIEPSYESFHLPDKVEEDIVGIINAVNHKAGVNKFLFEGHPGTGKTETVKHLSRILERQLFSVRFDVIVDSRLGQTAKNLVEVFSEIRYLPNKSKVMILFDEIDAISLDRINNNDLREMGRVTSTFLKEMDKMDNEILFIATTNLIEAFDKALLRRFDKIINFNRYSKEDLISVAESILALLLKKFSKSGRNMRLFRKILMNSEVIPYPGDLKNLIKTSLAFSDPSDEFDYMKRFMKSLYDIDAVPNIKDLYKNGFTVREIEILKNISKSQVSRELRM